MKTIKQQIREEFYEFYKNIFDPNSYTMNLINFPSLDIKYPFTILKDDLYESSFNGFTWIPSSSYLYDLNIRDLNDYECIFIEDKYITIINVDNDWFTHGSITKL